MTLSRFEGDTDAYLTAIQQRVKKFKTVGVNPVTIGGKEVQIEIHPSNHQLLMRDGDTSVKKAFIYTEKGFKLYEPITIAGKTFEEFNVSDDYTELSTPNGSIKTGLVYTLPYDFSNYRKVLTFSPMDYKCSSNEKLRNLFYSSLKALENKGSFTVSPEFKLGYLQDKDFLSSEWRDRQGINFTAWYENASSEANYILDFLPVGGKPNQVNIVMVEKGMQWNYYDLLDPVIEYITQNSPYEVIDVDSAYQYELRSVKDPSVRFRSYVYQWTYPLVYDFTSQKGTIEFVDGKVSTRMLKAFTDVKTYKKTTNNTEVTRTLDTKVVLGKNSVRIGNKNRNRTGFTFTIHQTAAGVANLTGSFNVVYILDFITTQCSEKQLNFVDNYNYNNYNWSSNKELAPLVDMFVENAPYETLDNGDGTLKYTSVKDSEVWFIVTK